MGKEPYRIDEFSFSSRADYERAKKEKETVTYLKASIRSGDWKAQLKIYNRSIEKESFRTVIGIAYMRELRQKLVDSGAVSQEALAPVPVPAGAVIASRSEKVPAADFGLEQQVKHYKEAYESARAGQVIKNIAIIVLVIVIVAILILTYRSQYSIVTYFTNYKEEMREELINEYEQWQTQLEQKEQELQEREALLQDTGE